MTQEELIAHYTSGVTACLVCGADPLHGNWTDYNGQIRCYTCGVTYQILGSHLKDEYLEELGLAKEDVAQQYCDCLMTVPLLKDYWNETGNRIPYGTYLGRSPISASDYENFSKWLKENAETYREEYKENFYWDRITGGE